jgi:hypothetical protein
MLLSTIRIAQATISATQIGAQSLLIRYVILHVALLFRRWAGMALAASTLAADPSAAVRRNTKVSCLSIHVLFTIMTSKDTGPR